IGPYDVSARRAERHISWHFNTGDPAAPTRAAGADQYRRQYYKPGIMQHLIAQASLTGALEQMKPGALPEPQMTMWIDEVGLDPAKLDGQGRVPVRQRQLTLKIAIDDFPLEEMESVAWRLGNAGALQNFAAAPGTEREAPLTLPPQPGIYRVD